jgi:histone H3/H4
MPKDIKHQVEDDDEMEIDDTAEASEEEASEEEASEEEASEEEASEEEASEEEASEEEASEEEEGVVVETKKSKKVEKPQKKKEVEAASGEKKKTTSKKKKVKSDSDSDDDDVEPMYQKQPLLNHFKASMNLPDHEDLRINEGAKAALQTAFTTHAGRFIEQAYVLQKTARRKTLFDTDIKQAFGMAFARQVGHLDASIARIEDEDFKRALPFKALKRHASSITEGAVSLQAQKALHGVADVLITRAAKRCALLMVFGSKSHKTATSDDIEAAFGEDPVPNEDNSVVEKKAKKIASRKKTGKKATNDNVDGSLGSGGAADSAKSTSEKKRKKPAAASEDKKKVNKKKAPPPQESDDSESGSEAEETAQPKKKVKAPKKAPIKTVTAGGQVIVDL